MKDTIIQLLSSDEFNDFLKGIDLFEENVKSGNLKSEDLDQEIIERACGIMVIERWADHHDYEERLAFYMEELSSNYADLISDDAINHHLKGIALFLDGLSQGDYSPEGFLYSSHTGFLMSSTAAAALAEHMSSKNRLEGSAFFKDMAAFFASINDRQFALVSILNELDKWNVPMTHGFYNILTAAQVPFQSWMLGGLHKVVEDPIVKENIFDAFLELLNTVKIKCQEENEVEALNDLDYIINMVEEKAKGQ